ncbi:hypothetical protein HD597_005263 [Nonomuraea thailandensis]|uniref:Uncharacterized protein n=1 Tax=Nonomuraea thailandensis TaxID=1188745 RepID=A0A9X2GPS5_9ACTN|nr:hypothetical protein [Nonomuraea thailandensis]MCP2358243.1 hypothetical protein [Nonomuraea thailandensis]
MTTSPLHRLETTVLVDHHSFDLLDDGGPQEAVPDFADPSRWLFTGRNAITVVSQDGSPHPARVTVELWPAAPDPAPGGVRAEVQLDSGDLEVNPLVDPDAGWIDLGGPGMYEVEAYQPEDGHYVFRIWNPAGGPP